MSKADGKCTKCNGTGFVSSPRMHLGAPGLCFQCNGRGTYEAWLERRAEVVAAGRVEARRMEVEGPVMTKVFERKNAADSRALKGFEFRQDVSRFAKARPVFTTCEFAEAFDCDKRAAFDTLCDLYPMRVVPVFDYEAGKAIGWQSAR